MDMEIEIKIKDNERSESRILLTLLCKSDNVVEGNSLTGSVRFNSSAEILYEKVSNPLETNR
jgi:hypothetical protein